MFIKPHKLRMLILTASLLVSLISGCASDRPAAIEFVFQDDFRGIAIIRCNEPNGVTIATTNGLTTMIFPKSGILEIKGETPTFKWHTITARYENGITIPVDLPSISNLSSNNVPDDVIAVRSLGVKGDKEDWNLVGKADEVKAALAKKNGFDFPFKH